MRIYSIQTKMNIKGNIFIKCRGVCIKTENTIFISTSVYDLQLRGVLRVGVRLEILYIIWKKEKWFETKITLLH